LTTLYYTLFASAFLSATLLPGSSEALLAGLIADGEANVIMLIIIATVGNVLGSVVNWLMGRYMIHFMGRWWFPVSEKHYLKAKKICEERGLWMLLFAWVPIIGDPITVFAGAFRVGFLKFLVLVTIGKLFRYVFIASVAQMWFGAWFGA
jgi:membrane protein YqaA with SNARE-associated domain